jgi:hypothetical protein
MTPMSLHFFEESQALAFVATCRDMKITGTQHRAENAPRFHVCAHCKDEKTRKLLIEEWSRRSIERIGH